MPKTCFVVMPVSDGDGYTTGHFRHVYDDIFVPACEAAGYKAVRADEVRETNLIHLDVLQKLLESPMVLCDLSSRNPNVLFELGLRQAFDKPVVLVQETGTPKIFDIAPLRYTEYRRERVYHQVLEDQKAIADCIAATEKAAAAGSGVNSLVRILSLTKPASLAEVRDAERDPTLDLVRAEINEMRHEMRRAIAFLAEEWRSGGSSGREVSAAVEIDAVLLEVSELHAILLRELERGSPETVVKPLLEHLSRLHSRLLEMEGSARRSSPEVFRKLREARRDLSVLSEMVGKQLESTSRASRDRSRRERAIQ